MPVVSISVYVFVCVCARAHVHAQKEAQIRENTYAQGKKGFSIFCLVDN